MRPALGERLGFHTPRQVGLTIALACLACGLRSLALGQDTAWDLLNYHLYAPWAWWHARLGLDLAPAQLQSYFPPIGDLPYWLLLQLDAPRLAGFLMGALHGLAFALVAAIAWLVLPADRSRPTVAPALALAGLFSVTFVSELGGSMGNNTSALPVLAALGVLMKAQRNFGRRSLVLHAVAGVGIGIAVALKLTNAPFAVAMAVAALMFGSGSIGWRTRGLSVMTASALLIFALMAGDWFFQVWRTFGNPLIPQANGWFEAPLADSVSIADQRWLPIGWLEHLAWPIVFTLHPQRVGEEGLRQLLWIALPVVAIACLVTAAVRRGSRPAAAVSAHRPVALLTTFFVVSFVIWMLLFSIHRYLTVLELLGPLLIWLGVQWSWPTRAGRRVATAALVACSLVAWFGQGEWGHEDWAEHSFAIEVPALPDAAHTTGLLVGKDPQAWRAALLPDDIAWVGVATTWPETAAYRDRVRQIVADRQGPAFAMLPAATDRRARRRERYNELAARFGFDTGPECSTMRWLGQRRLEAAVEVVDGRCRFTARAADAVDLPDADRSERATADAQLAGYGFQLDAGQCVRLGAWAGKREYPYQWCPVHARSAEPAR
ncbi:hypothetical protein BH10PSE17_BH10PSE17_26620 [soil metagenome]